jgi:hypothetical protein
MVSGASRYVKQGEGKRGGDMVAKGIFKKSDSYVKLQKKPSGSTVKLIGFDFGPNTIQIQASIAKELLKTKEEETTKAFEELCRAFREVCLENRIKFDPIDLFVLTDNKIKRGTSTKFRDSDDNSLFAEVLIPSSDFKMHEYWKYTLLHELGHSWFSIELSAEDKEFGYEDLLIDLVAICTFRKILPPQKWVYQEVRKHRPYFLTQQTKRFLGRELYRQILQDPEGHLWDLREKIYSSKTL